MVEAADFIEEVERDHDEKALSSLIEFMNTTNLINSLSEEEDLSENLRLLISQAREYADEAKSMATYLNEDSDKDDLDMAIVAMRFKDAIDSLNETTILIKKELAKKSSK